MRRFLLAALAVLVLAAAASADDVVIPLTVKPGPLTLAPATVITKTAQISVTVVDARGRGAGWELLARAPMSVGGPVMIQGVEPRCGLHSTCTWPRNDTRYPIVLNAWRPTVVFRAQPGTGMGTISMIVKLRGPARIRTTVSFSVRPG
jgi:opacity protein-like surface antigen